jgi:hypothetical protein
MIVTGGSVPLNVVPYGVELAVARGVTSGTCGVRPIDGRDGVDEARLGADNVSGAGGSAELQAGKKAMPSTVIHNIAGRSDMGAPILPKRLVATVGRALQS